MSHFDEEDFLSIDDLNEDEEEDLREKLDMHSIILSSTNQPFLTAEQVISEIDFMLKDLTPDSGIGDQSYLEYDLKTQTRPSLNQLIEELNHSIQDLSSILVEELAHRDELEEEKETKNTFIELLFHIQVAFGLFFFQIQRTKLSFRRLNVSSINQMKNVDY